MLRIREEKRAIPCEKDTSIILACLNSGMKWFGEDVGEQFEGGSKLMKEDNIVNVKRNI